MEEGSEVILRNVTLPKGKFIEIRPHETDFINLSNPKAMYVFLRGKIVVDWSRS